MPTTHNSEVDPHIALETLRKLAPYGFGDAEFELVHHWGAKGKLTSFERYCKWLIERRGLFRRGDNNHLLHLRLLSMLKRCNDYSPDRKDFKSLAAEAMKAHSPIEKDAT
jgi:hypothetical protein